MVNWTFISQSFPDIRKKIVGVGWALGMNPWQLVDTVYNKREIKKQQQQTATVFVEQANSQRQRGPKGRKRQEGPLSPAQSASAKAGHWKNECPKREDNRGEQSQRTKSSHHHAEQGGQLGCGLRIVRGHQLGQHPFRCRQLDRQ